MICKLHVFFNTYLTSAVCPYMARTHFKICLFAFKSLNGLAPPYQSELLHVYTSTCSLVSADQLFLSVPKAKMEAQRGQHLGCGSSITMERSFLAH